MNELVKTGIYLGVAVLLCLSAFFVRPSHQDVIIQDQVGKDLVPEFNDPEDASGLKITSYDEELARLKTFEVTRSKQYQNWVIPSHYDYPADAKEQMEIVASALADLKVLDVASADTADHETFGVVEPADDQELKKGVGIRVEVTNNEGKVVVDMIVGKGVADAEEQRFVRLTGQDLVYVVKLDPSKLSTKFEDWIEKDLLQLTSSDVARASYRDYAVVPTPGGRVRIESRLEMDVRWDTTANKWQLEKMLEFVQNEPQASALLPGEELDDQVLNDMKNALDDLKIVDVRRKPKGLGADLRVSNNLRKDATSLESLLTRGFYPISRQSAPDEVELLSANGEIHVSTQAGVQYVLRFGGIAASENTEEVNRYMFVTTRLDESLIDKPELKPLPSVPATQPAAGKDEKKDAKDAAAKAEIDAEKERDRIKKENERLQKEYDDKLKGANDKIKELNARFADWYYIISDSEFKKVHLNRDQMIKLSDKAKDEAIDLDAFRKLQTDGIEKKEEPASPAGGPPNFGGGLPPGLGQP